MKFTREIKVGLLTIVAIILFIFGYYYLKGQDLLEPDRVYYAVYENVEGLPVSAPVTINGLKVGNIDDIRFLDSEGRLLVKFHVSNEFEFAKDSEAQIYSTGLIGGKALAILPSYNDIPMAESGDTLPSGQKEGLPQEVMNEFLPLKDKIENAVVNVDTLLSNLNKVITPELGTNVNNTLEDVQVAVSNANKLLRDIDGVIVDNRSALDSTIQNLNKTSSNFAAISDTLSKVRIAQTVRELENTVSGINDLLEQVENGEGSLGKLMTDDKLYTNLENTAKQAEELLRDIKLHPKRYVHFSVFGKKPKDYEPVDDEE